MTSVSASRPIGFNPPYGGTTERGPGVQSVIVRLILALAASVGLTLAIVWLAGKLLQSPATTPSPAQAAASAKVDRNYRILVRRLQARGKRVGHIKAARGAWARRANRICARAMSEVKTAFGEGIPAKTPTALYALVSKVEAIGADAQGQLRALPPPRYDAKRVETMLDLSDQALALDRALISAIRERHRGAAVRLARQEARLIQRANSLATALGAYVCAEDPFFDNFS